MRARVDVWLTHTRGARHFCSSAPLRVRTRWEEFKEFASHFSPRTKPELRFDNFPRKTGHEITLGVIFGINVVVFAGWQIPQLQDVWTNYFLWSNRGLKEGKWWLLFTPSFSHQDFGHLAANMTFLLYLGKRLHQFMGRARFIALYLSGSVAGTLASDLNPAYQEEKVAKTPARYINIMNGQPMGTAESLGASDAVMAILACWYFVFPRTQIHVFRTVSMLTDFLRYRGYTKLTSVLDKYHPTCSALWFLPLVFVSDFLKVMGAYSTSPSGHLSLAEKTNVSSHVAGFAAGSLFHLFVTRPLKAQHFSRNWYEISRRAVLMPLSLGVYSFAMYKLNEMNANKQGLAAVRFELESAQKPSLPSVPDMQALLRWPTLVNVTPSSPQLMKKLRDADECSAREAYLLHRMAAQSENKDHLQFGQCDALFRAVRKAVEESDPVTAAGVIRSIKLKEPSPEETEELEKWMFDREKAQRIQSMSWSRYLSFVLTGQ